MTNPIINTAIKVMPEQLQVQWGMIIEDKKLLWSHDNLELRLYCDPPLALTNCNPTTDLFPTDKSSNTEASVSLFGIGSFAGGKSEDRKRFFASLMSEDKNGHYYPVRIDVSDFDIPDASAIYPAITWTPVDSNWLDNDFQVSVVMGRTIGSNFEVLYRPTPYLYHPDNTEDETAILPDMPVVVQSERVRHRGARPKLFISYAHANVGVVNPYAKRLSDDFYYDVWIDYDGIRTGKNWKEELSLGIQQADAVIFMLTPESLKSEWCIAELTHARKHNKLILPLRLNSAVDPKDIKPIEALQHIQYLDFVVTDTDPVWQKLIQQLHDAGIRVPLREIQLLENPRFRQLHREYLQRLFNEFEHVDLSYLLDARPDRPISLLDVYVPLRLGVDFNIEVESSEYAGWWLREVDKPIEKPEDEIAKELDKPTSLNGFQPDADTISVWETRMKDGWARFKIRHEQREAEKEESKRKPLKDQTYRWGRIESEIAPALMKYLVITGDPGSGKSTLLRHIALAMAGQQLEDGRASLDNLNFWPHPAFTPVFIPLRALIRSTFPDPEDKVTLDKILNYIRDHILKPFKALDYEDFLRTQMSEGDVIFMLDGLDEVPEADERRDQVQAIVKELRTYADCRIIVTSRPYAYYAKDWQMSDFGHVDLVTLEADRLNQLAEQLFQAVLQDDQQAKQQIEAFNQQIKNVPADLKASPLFFTLLASIWLTDTDIPEAERLPDTRGRMYRKCIESLIARWTYKEGDSQSTADLIGLDEARLRQVLELIAYRVHSQAREDDDAQFEGGEIMNAIAQLKLKRVNPFELIDALAQRSGIVIGKYENVYQFAHRSFQEHLSACYLARSEQFPSKLIEDVQASPNLWRNVLELIPDEVDKRDLWDFVRKQLPTKKIPLPESPDDARWWLIYYAIRWIKTHDLMAQEDDDDIRDILEKRLKQALTTVIELGALPASERAEMGRLLAELGDPRVGVGLRDDGLPDIIWGKPVPAGDYIIGGDEEAGQSEEQAVTFAYSYKLAQYTVTYQQYQVFVEAQDGFDQDEWWDGFPDEEEVYGEMYKVREMNSQYQKFTNHPRDNVSWYQAVAFCRWLTTRYRDAGLITKDEEIRLPTEKEWEVVARYSNGQFYPWGNDFDPEKSNTSEGANIGKTSAVGMYPAGKNSELELYDLSGNVWEWTLTEYESGDDGYNISGRRVLRGGSFNGNRQFSRSAFRYSCNPSLGYDLYGGFRCVCASILAFDG